MVLMGVFNKKEYKRKQYDMRARRNYLKFWLTADGSFGKKYDSTSFKDLKYTSRPT